MYRSLLPPSVASSGPSGTHRKGRVALTVLAGLLAAGCVTINIYFPAAAAEKAADRIIDEVWQLQQEGKAVRPPAPASAPVPAGEKP